MPKRKNSGSPAARAKGPDRPVGPPAFLIKQPYLGPRPGAVPVVHPDDGWESADEGADSQPWHPTVRVDTRKNLIGGSAHRARWEDRVVVLVNQARRRARLPPLRADQRLRQSARDYSARMAELGFFAHEDPDGSTAEDRMRAAGHPDPGGENIARGHTGPEEVMHSWLNSPGHRATIVTPDFRSIGVGLHLGPGGPWWTQHFGY